MIMTNKIFTIFLAAFLILVSCSKNEEIINSPLRISLKLPMNLENATLEQAEATLDLLQYILSDEVQDITSEVHYAPLPAKAKELSMENLKTVTYDGVAILQ